MPIRVVTAAAIFDGHDAAIGIFRRILQSQGCEVIHLGHDRGLTKWQEQQFKRMLTQLQSLHTGRSS